ncbi:MAG: hypothetical protein ABL962_03325 [Fimbriimonadaceae bacterium]
MIALSLSIMLGSAVSQKAEKVAFSFNGAQYVHRYTKDNLHEYTPKGKPDLKSWTDMVTINDYPSVKTGEDLAKSANSVLETYKEHKAVVVRTDSVPKTPKKEAEHLIVVMFTTPSFIETAFARFVIADGYGHSVVYSHRVYGKKAGDAMSAWLLTHGEKSEKALMAMPTVPKR